MATRILIVDDSVSMRRMVCSALRSASFDVVEAANGPEALTVLDRHQVDLIITDVNMPDMDGISLVRAIRNRPATKSTPVLILTTESGVEMKQAGRTAGATGWIIKPFSPQQLVQVVAKVLPPEAS